MGFFSGIGKAIGKVAGAAGDFLGSTAGQVVGSLAGSGLSFLGQERANAANSAMSAEQMAWQERQNRLAEQFTGSQAKGAMAFTHDQALRANRFTDWQQDKAMQFNERMASTQWQRGVKDMMAAGINPMLAVSQGAAAAPTVSGGAGAAGSGVAGHGVSSAGSMATHRSSVPSDLMSSALGAIRSMEDIRNVRAARQNVEADTVNKILEGPRIQADTTLKGSQSYQATTQGHVNQQTEDKLIKTVGPLVESIRASADQSRASAAQTRSQNLLMKDLMANPVTRPFAPLLNIIFK